MKNQVLLIALLLLSSLGWYSCQKEDENKPEIEKPVAEDGPWSAANNSLFWRISGNGLEQPAHLFGTIHTIHEQDFSYQKGLDSLLNLSTSVMLEVNISDPAIIAAVQQRMVWPEGVNPDDMYTDEEVEILGALCRSLNTQWRAIKQLNPISLEAYLMGQIMTKELGANEGYEGYLIKRSIETNTPLLGAESPEYVYSYFQEISNDEVIERLINTAELYLDDSELALESFYELVHAYLQQDLAELHQLSFDSDEESNTYKLLVADRNKEWLQAIENDLSGRLVAVGAGHLGGSKGLVQLLRDLGYEVNPIKVAR
mgnify:FL=1